MGAFERPRTLHDLWRVVAKDYLASEEARKNGETIETLAEHCDCSVSTFYAHMEPEDHGSGRPPTTKRVFRLAEKTRDPRIPEFFEEAFGRMGYRRPGERPDFTGKVLDHIDLTGQDLRGVSFRDAKLFGVNLERAHLDGADLGGAYILDGCNFDRAHLVGANLKARQVDRAMFRQADLRSTEWKNAGVSNADFRDCIHTGADFRGVSWGENIRWFADHYRGGLLMAGSRGLENFIGVTESHGFNRWLILRAGQGRPKWKMLAGWMEVDIQGEWQDVGCWLQLLHIIETEIPDSEQREVFEVLTEEQQWGNHVRIAFERMKQAWVQDLYVDGRPPTRQQVNKAIVGRECELLGVKGRVSRGGLFVPDGADFEHLVKATGVDNVIDQIVHEKLVEKAA